MGGVDLQIKSGEFVGFLLIVIELFQASLELSARRKSSMAKNGMGSGRQLLLPNAVQFRQSTELFISGDQRPATVKCRGRDQAISWIAMLKQGVAGENSDSSRDWQYLQTQGLQQP